MTSRARLPEESIPRRLRQTTVLLIHPDDEDGRALLLQLKRIGCLCSREWPAPSTIDPAVDAALFQLDTDDLGGNAQWMSGEGRFARIAIIGYETPAVLTALGKANVHGVISRPVRIFGVLAALTTALNTARHEQRLLQRITALDNTLRARRRIEKAVQILARNRSIEEGEAYRRIRDRSMSENQSITELAEAIIAAEGL